MKTGLLYLFPNLKFLFIAVIAVGVFSQPAFALNAKTASKIYTKIFKAMLDKDRIYVYVENEKYMGIFNYTDSMEYAANKENSDIILVTTKEELSMDDSKIFFTTEIALMEQHDNILGAFYWDHGRPKIIFIKDRLEKHNIKLHKSFQKYIQEGT